MNEKDLTKFYCSSSDFTSGDYYDGLRKMKQSLINDGDVHGHGYTTHLLDGITQSHMHHTKAMADFIDVFSDSEGLSSRRSNHLDLEKRSSEQFAKEAASNLTSFRQRRNSHSSHHSHHSPIPNYGGVKVMPLNELDIIEDTKELDCLSQSGKKGTVNLDLK